MTAQVLISSEEHRIFSIQHKCAMAHLVDFVQSHAGHFAVVLTCRRGGRKPHKRSRTASPAFAKPEKPGKPDACLDKVPSVVPFLRWDSHSSQSQHIAPILPTDPVHSFQQRTECRTRRL